MSSVLTTEATVTQGVDGPRVERAVREYLLAIGEDPEHDAEKCKRFSDDIML